MHRGDTNYLLRISIARQAMPSRCIRPVKPLDESIYNIRVASVAAAPAMLDQGGVFVREDRRVLAEIIRMIRNEHPRVQSILFKATRFSVITGQIILCPPTGLIAEVDVVATLRLPISALSLLPFK